MKLVLLNVKYSPNLGDGIIAECLEHALREADADLSVVSCDLAGRTDYGQGINRSRRAVYAILDRLPSPLRRAAFASLIRYLVRTRLRKHYREYLDGAGGVVIGGGQLIADADLNFPIKISEAVRAARDAGAAIAVHGVGVGAGFSPKGKQLLADAFRPGLAFANVRDARSVARWNEHFSPPQAGCVGDPGLLASRVYPPPARSGAARPLIGIGVINPSTLKLHADHGKSASAAEWKAFFARLAEALAADGQDVELFTNGAHDDIVFARDVLNLVKTPAQDQDGTVALAQPMHRPRDLAGCIARYDGLVAHRLHANIIAYSYAVPHVGLGWDSKMEGFFEASGRREYLFASAHVPDVQVVKQRLCEAVEAGVDPAHVTQQMDRIQLESRQLLDAFGEVPRGKIRPQLNKSG